MHRNWNIVLVAVLGLLLSACSSTTYLSQMATEEFLIDGQRSEWTGRFQIPEGESFAIGFSHNKNYLYVAISSIDKDFKRNLTMGGLTIWLDVEGGKRENLGIKFEGAMPFEKRPRSSRRNQQNIPLDREKNFDHPEIFDGDLTLIVTDTKAGKSLGPADLLASANSIDETIFIEYQIPLAMLGENFDQEKLGLGLKSTIERPAKLSSPSRGRSGGMGEGMNGGRNGGMGGGGRPGGNQGSRMNNSDLEIWTIVNFPR